MKNLPTQAELQAMPEDEQLVQKQLIAEELAKEFGLDIGLIHIDRYDFIEMHKGILGKIILQAYLIGSRVAEEKTKESL